MGAAGGRALCARAAIGGRAPSCWVSVRAGAVTVVGLRSGAVGTAVSAAAAAAPLPQGEPGREAAVSLLRVSAAEPQPSPWRKAGPRLGGPRGVQAAVWSRGTGGEGRACGGLNPGGVRGWGLKTGRYDGSRRGQNRGNMMGQGGGRIRGI